MTVEIEYTDEFEEWWNKLDESEQESVAAVVQLLEEHGPHLNFPHSSGIALARHRHMRELRIQHKGNPLSGALCFRSEKKCDFTDWRQ
jgi:hypothetical protein